MANFKTIGRNIGKQIKEQVRKDYLPAWRKLANKGNGLILIIKDLISKGISPVRGGRFQRYSESYRESILGKAFYFNRNGRVIRGEPGTKGLGVGKKQSPVNLNLTGDMIKSLNYSESTGVIGFKDQKAKWHNDGEGKLPERRLLPDRSGERFNRRIEQRLREALVEAVRKTAAKKLLGVVIRFKVK